ncbi:solute carrier family 35 member G1 [Brachionus plicatilis]|uniref:Solute carrier family 35 member G1 n=1 Tax=Brachionus plicatilis TaxID=10195 RepID=A0A3M7PMQ6_BRAPC|nr:solute carrier family 35 member G1 [Brachionus plicatilis]
MMEDSKNQEKANAINLENVYLNPEKLVPPSDQTSDENLKIGFKHKLFKHRGIFYSLAAALFISFSGILTKYCEYFNGSEIAGIRYFFQFTVMLVFAVCHKEKLLGEAGQRKILMFRALFGTIGLLVITLSFKLIDPSDTISLVNCSIIIVSVLSRIILKEKYTICHLLALTMTFSGVLFIAQPSFLISKKSHLNKTNLVQNNTIESQDADFNRYLGIGFGLVGAFAASVVSILLKKLANNKVHFSIAIIYASYLGFPVCSLISFILLYTGQEVKPYIKVGIAVLSAISGLMGQACMNFAFSHEDVTKVSLCVGSSVNSGLGDNDNDL